MSEVKVNKLSPRSGTTVTLGDSGDTITIPSGVTFDASSGGLAGTLTTAAQPNITSVGTLTSFTSTGIDDNATSVAITIDSSEKVGIGTTSPQRILHIHDSQPYLQLTSSSTGTTSTDGFQLIVSGSEAVLMQRENSPMSFYTNNTERMRIDNSGKVSIGDTTSSGYRLKIKGTTANDADDQGILLEEAGTGGAFIKYDGSANLLKLGGYNAGEVDSINIVRNTGDVGIGTTSPTQKLDVSGQINVSNGITFSGALSSGTGIASSGASGNLRLYSDGVQVITVTSSNVGIGTTSPTAMLELFKAGTTQIKNAYSSTKYSLFGRTGGNYYWSAYEGGANLIFSTSASDNATTERMRIDSVGNLKVSRNGAAFNVNSTHQLIDNLANSYSLMLSNKSSSPASQYMLEIGFKSSSPDNSSAKFIEANDSTTTRFRVNSDGDVYNHDGTYGTISDERIKQDIIDASSQWEDIKNIRVRKYKKKDDVLQYGEENAPTEIGVISQELETVSPGLIKEQKPNSSHAELHEDFAGENPQNVKYVKYSILYMKSIKALQEAMERIETLEARITELENA